MITMPTPEELGQMSPEEIENLKIQADNEANEISKQISTLQLERNNIKRQDLMLSDAVNKAKVNKRDLVLTADTLDKLFWRKRKGY